MKFQIGESMCDIGHYLPLARAADEAGFDTFSLGDSVLYPETAVGDYPYTETGDRSFLEGAPFLDPFQLFAAMSVVTTRIKFATGVLKLPIRNPVLVAKQVSSLAVLTQERFTLGECPPIIIGGHSKPAYRRAARYGDGVNLISLEEGELVDRRAVISGFRREYGRESEPFAVTVGMPAESTDEMHRLEDLGVTNLAASYRPG